MLNGWMIVNDELARMWKEVAIVCFKVLIQNLHGRT